MRVRRIMGMRRKKEVMSPQGSGQNWIKEDARSKGGDPL